MEIRVEFNYWKANSGYSHSETFENFTTEDIDVEFADLAEWYYLNAEIDWSMKEDEGINIEMYDEDDNLISEYFVEGFEERTF